MARLEHLSGGQFHTFHFQEDSFGDIPGRSHYIAMDPHNRQGPMGVLAVDNDTVDHVYVDPAYRRSGPRAPSTPVADHLYEAAGRPAHSPDRTGAGNRFAQRVGGEVPSRSRSSAGASSEQDRTIETMLRHEARSTFLDARQEALRSRQPFPAPPTGKRWY